MKIRTRISLPAALRALLRGAYVHSAGSWGYFRLRDRDLI